MAWSLGVHTCWMGSVIPTARCLVLDSEVVHKEHMLSVKEIE